MVEVSMNNTKCSGFIYILHTEGTDRFKIGHSVDPVTRCQNISQQSPFPINLICYYPSDNVVADERRLHEMFSHRRVHGEWFVFESIEHAKGLIDEFFRIRAFLANDTEPIPFSFYNKQLESQSKNLLITESRAKLKAHWEKMKSFPGGSEVSALTQAVYLFIIESFAGEPIAARDCYRKSSLRTQFGLNAERTEQVFEELQVFGLGEKIVEEINGFRSVKFLPRSSD